MTCLCVEEPLNALAQDKAVTAIGIPYLSGSERVDFTTVQQFTAEGSTKTDKVTTAIPVTLDQLVPGMTAQVVTTKVPASAITVRVRRQEGWRKRGDCQSCRRSTCAHAAACLPAAAGPRCL